MNEPKWTLTELAQHKKISLIALRSRIKSERCQKENPLPSYVLQGEIFIKGSKASEHNLCKRRGTQHTKRYDRSQLLAWFDREEQHKTFKRI